MVLMIDNYDSFTYNIVQCIGSMGAQVEVYRNGGILQAVLREIVGRGGD